MPPKSQVESTTTPRKKNISRKERAGLIFPPTRFDGYLRKENPHRIRKEAGIFIAGALEYLTSEIIAGATVICKESGRSIIKPRDVNRSIREDSELAQLLGDVQIMSGGIHLPTDGVVPAKTVEKKTKKPTTKKDIHVKKSSKPTKPKKSTKKSSDESDEIESD